MYLYEQDSEKQELQKKDEDLEDFLKDLDEMDKPEVKTDIEPEVRNEISAIVDNETKKNEV